MEINPLIFNSLLNNVVNGEQNSQTAANEYYTVRPGDGLWKIAMAHKIRLSELIAANPQIRSPYLVSRPKNTDSRAWQYCRLNGGRSNPPRKY